LNLYFLAQRFGKLPEDGGLRDQIAGELDRMAAAYDVYAAVRLYRSWPIDKMSEFPTKHPDVWRIIKDMMELYRNGG